MEDQSDRGVLLAGKWVTGQQIREQLGKSREDTADAFNVSVSTFSRKCKELGIKWPYPQRKRSRHSSSQSGSKKQIASTKESGSSSNKETSQLLQMKETSSTSRHQRNNQNNDIPIGQVIEGINMPNSIIDHDVVDHIPSLESVSAQQCIEKMKSRFDQLIRLPLEHLSNPQNETCMKKALSILADNLYWFSKEQAQQILKLYVDFPILVHNWREYSRFQMYSQKSSAETEKSRDLVENSMKDAESLEKKEKDLRRQLDAVEKEEAEIAKQRTQISNDKENLNSKVKENEAGQKDLKGKATAKFNKLSEEWTKLRSSFLNQT